MNFDVSSDRRNTNSIKWNRDAIENISANPVAEPFWVADMDFYPEQHIQEAGKTLAGQGIYGYPSFPKDTAHVAAWMDSSKGKDRVRAGASACARSFRESLYRKGSETPCLFSYVQTIQNNPGKK